ncbi:MAG: HEN1 C-terminal domain; double-stranded RNA 3'-methylase [uncultured Corynebacteriales bacterium]|uniref:Small RNA 2'-O-methyltransferase n=1 Tax=uncultured Mycobacteriales bacterium TaxID=581187 RepID=A0A6J4JAF5_9ACTN|nr:MAG: HEN1 C-terminal domain; double-stranded RNA 3'-methylase [uncultured Corynebacteriales bacterium]
MLVTLSTTHVPATDLGFLLHKNPARAQRMDLSTGTAHVFYPEATEQRCTAALLLEVDPIALVRGAPEGFSLGRYVNDRPYAASSLLAVALGKVFGSARRGVSKERPDLVDVPLPLEVHLPALSCRGGPELAERFFAPLGWQVAATAVPLDETVPDWGPSRYVDLRLTGRLRLADAINHLYVALPVLDDAKHYWVSTDEIDKLLRAGQGWLGGHPDRELITARYLAHQRSLTRAAIERLTDDEPVPGDTAGDTDGDTAGDTAGGPGPGAAAGHDAVDAAEATRPVPLAVRRHDAVLAELRAAGASRVVDLGAGAGALLPALLADPRFTEIVAVDVSARALETAARRLHVDRMPERQRARLTFLQSALTYTDARLRGYDAAVLMEVVEHVDPDRLPALEHAVFGSAAPATVVLTTPNAEHNVRYPGLAGGLRHRDHRFEWTRAELATWAAAVADRYGYAVRTAGIGDDDPAVGPPTQLAVFTREAR